MFNLFKKHTKNNLLIKISKKQKKMKTITIIIICVVIIFVVGMIIIVSNKNTNNTNASNDNKQQHVYLKLKNENKYISSQNNIFPANESNKSKFLEITSSPNTVWILESQQQNPDLFTMSTFVDGEMYSIQGRFSMY